MPNRPDFPICTIGRSTRTIRALVDLLPLGKATTVAARVEPASLTPGAVPREGSIACPAAPPVSGG